MSGPQERGRGCKVKQKTGFPEAMGECSPSDEKKEVATAIHPSSQPASQTRCTNRHERPKVTVGWRASPGPLDTATECQARASAPGATSIHPR